MEEKGFILVIEDDENNLQNAKKAYGSAGFIVETCKTVEDGIKKIKEGNFNYIVSDVNIPYKEGEEPKDHSKDIIKACYEKGVSLVFVSAAGAHGYSFTESRKITIILALRDPDGLYTILSKNFKDFIPERGAGILEELDATSFFLGAALRVRYPPDKTTRDLFEENGVKCEILDEEEKTERVWRLALSTLERLRDRELSPLGELIKKRRRYTGRAPDLNFLTQR
jgi:CheY-like chemotaxis protein